MLAVVRGHRASLVLIALVWAAAVCADEPVELILGTDHPVHELTAELPWEFELVSAGPADEASMALVPECRESRIVRIRSLQPLRDTAAGPVYLELTLTSLRFDSADDARAAFASVMYGADPDTGLSYAWDLLVASGCELHLLHAPCLLSSSHWEAVAEAFRAMLGRVSEEPSIARCSCGRGCRTAS